MVSRENGIGAVCIAPALVLVYAVPQVPGAPDWAPTALLLGVGVVVPLLVTGYLDDAGSEGA